MRIMGILFWGLCFFQAKGQLTIEELKTLELGQPFDVTEPALFEKFSENISVYKGDRQNTYKIVAPYADSLWIYKKDGVTFDAYGEAKLSFQFANHVLIAVEVRFEFTAETRQKERFEQTLKALITGFTEDKDFFALQNPTGQEFKVDNIIQDIKSNCSTKEENEEYPKQSAFLGTAAWEIHKRVDNIPRHKLLTLQAYKTGITSYPYSGCIAVIELVVSNEAFFNLYNNVNAAKIKYEEIEE